MTTRRLAGLVLAFSGMGLLGGCASVIYKDTATTFTTSGKAILKQYKDSNKSLQLSDDAIKTNAIVTDTSKQCPLQEDRVFVRPNQFQSKAVGSTIGAALTRYKTALPADCTAVVSCRENESKSVCKSACYSLEEKVCLSNLERFYANDIEAKKDGPDEALTKESMSYAKTLRQIEYGRAYPFENKLLKVHLTALTGYLDALGKLAEERKSEIPDAFANLYKSVDKANKDLKEFSSGKLVVVSAADLANVKKSTDAIGGFLGHLDKLQKAAEDVKEIKRLVVENKDKFEPLSKSIQPLILADGTLAWLRNQQAIEPVMKEISQKFNATTDPYARRGVLEERRKVKEGISATDPSEAITALFDAMNKSHATLVQLIVNPSDEQLKKIRSEQFDSFLSVVKELIDVMALI